MLRLLIVTAALALPAVAVAQDAAPPQRIRNITLQKGEVCPKSADGEIVVCAPAEVEPYRIPKQFRDIPKQDAPSTSWAVKTDRVMEDNRRVLPGSCSPIGTNGQTGCAQKAAEAWAAEKRAKANGVVEPQ
ncbi:hypothetical protein M9980_03875 [Sphingomonas donggukensis]|uniref:Secreted protein n=1 Tax=Sphingomonas donggukensis TaxID=2949093 RepID=A0ABY4TVE2_9SPHN|nr:hypothetical protein [Sphingomonas donggukensis]URW76370.1 hypothetical protein M9980_03875 [Sphingomonas donggukensis]